MSHPVYSKTKFGRLPLTAFKFPKSMFHRTKPSRLFHKKPKARHKKELVFLICVLISETGNWLYWVIASAGLLFILLLTMVIVIVKRNKRCGRLKVTRRGKKRAQWFYLLPPRVFFTRHEYQSVKEANRVGESVIKRRASTYATLPLCKVFVCIYG